MKKKLISLACAAALMPTFYASAECQPGLTELWKTGLVEDFKGNWSATLDWNSSDAIKGGSNPRFATASNGKVYVVNQMTMSIAEATPDGLKDVYKLPKPSNDANYYGTAISMDEAGNFLVGMNFVQAPGSSLNWAIYSPKTGQCKQFLLDAPAGMNIGRIDCVGRVLGDLTKEAIFFIAPQSGQTAKVRVVKVTSDGSVNNATMETLGWVDIEAVGGSSQQNIVQPAFTKYEEYEAAGAENYNFYYSSWTSTEKYTASYINGTLNNDCAPDMAYTCKAGINGFATFMLDGNRYFVRNWSLVAGDYSMNIVVMNEKGDALSIWTNTEWMPDGGYSSIIAEPLGDGTANIYVYNSGNKAGAAAMLNFDPSQAGAPVVPERPVGATPDDPYKISTASQLLGMAGVVNTTNFYVELENDIDLAGLAFSPIEAKATVHFDGKNHVIKNLYDQAAGSGNHALFGEFSGEVKNLGVENAYVYTNWGCGAALIGTAGTVTIDNCYTTGNISAAAVGCFVGAVSGSVTITNSYSLANVTDLNNHYAGGLVGRVGGLTAGAKFFAENCYAGGNVTSPNGTASGIASSSQAGSVVTINNAVAWNRVISGGAGKVDVMSAGLGEVDLGEFEVYDGLLMNGEQFVGCVSQQELLDYVGAWEGFSKTVNNGRSALAWQEANGNYEFLGAKSNPHRLYTAQDVVGIRNQVVAGDTYFSVENDINMGGIDYVAPINDNNFTGRVIHLEGNCHVIDSLTCLSGSYPSLIGVFMGEIRNLGLTNVNLAGGAVGVFGAFTGHASYDGETVIDNCYATGIVAATMYGGGIGGYNNGKLLISNSYTRVNVEAANYAAGVLGWTPGGQTTMKNVYAAGVVETQGAEGYAAGVVNAMDGSSVELNDVVSFVTSLYGVDVDRIAVINAGPAAITENNVLFCEDTWLNGDVEVEGGKSMEELQSVVSSWDAFSDKLEEDYPMLKWQAGESSGISDIVVEEGEANGPAVYYNLQGVQVANPENGIYIVRRGNKVTKELVR